MSQNIIPLNVLEENEGERLDRFLSDALQQFSREYLKTLIQEACVSVNTLPQCKPALRLKLGDQVLVQIPETQPLELTAEDIPLEILHEDSDLLVINKPSGILTHPAGSQQSGTLVNALLHHCKGQLSGINGIERPGIVHRLDKDTSGLMLVAKTDAAHRILQQQIQDRQIKRQYRAILQGELNPLEGTICAPIGRNPKHRDKMMVIDTGRYAVTHWRVLETLGSKFSVAQLTLETGRTHQIRVHMAHKLHPVFADLLYGTGLEKKLNYPSQGQILQSYQLAFTHPTLKKSLSFEIPPDIKFQHAYAFLHDWITTTTSIR